MKACVDRSELENFLRGKIPENRAEQIAIHVDDCETCQDTVVHLAGAEDTFVAGLKQQEDSPQHSVERENAFKHGLQRLLNGMTRPTTQGEVLPPEQIGPYVLEEPLGSGGMGHVYRAQHSKLKRTVALKILPAHRWSNAAAISRFEREMQAIGGLDHPHIVRASDAGEDEGMHYLVMEYVDGLDLGRLSKRLGQLPVPEACELARQAAIGLQHAHDNGLVHRDVKPSNVMLAREKSTELDSAATTRVKILDLGLALLGDEYLQEDHDMTSVGALMGTLDYMSPEQGVDSHGVDHRADIYGLGATLFKLLTGRAPYADPKNSTLMKKMTALATKSAPSVGSVRPDLPQPVIDIVDRMLARDPDERFASARDIAEALAAPADGADLSELVERGLSTAEPEQRPKLARTAVQTTPTLVPRMTAPNGSGRRFNRWALAVAAGFLSLIAAGGIWIATDYGTIWIESDEPDVEVVFRQGDKIVQRVTVEEGKGEVRMRPGAYSVDLNGGGRDTAITPGMVDVVRGQPSSVMILNLPTVEGDMKYLAAGDSGPTSLNRSQAEAAIAAPGFRLQPGVDARSKVTISGPRAVARGKGRFTVTVTNTGAKPLANGELSVAPGNITIAAATGNFQRSNANTFKWLIQELPPGYQSSVEFLTGLPIDDKSSALIAARFKCDEGYTQQEFPLEILQSEIVSKEGSSEFENDQRWQEFDVNAYEKAVNEGKPSLIFYSADWDMTGKTFETNVLHDFGMILFFDEHDVALFDANITSREGDAWERFQQIEGASVPLVEICNPALKESIVRREGPISVEKLQAAFGELPLETSPFADLAKTRRGTSPSTQLPRYNGRTLPQWLDDVKLERNRDRVKDAVNAVVAMFDDATPELVDESVETLFALMRRYGQEPYNFNLSGNSALCEKAFKTLTNLPPEPVSYTHLTLPTKA